MTHSGNWLLMIFPMSEFSSDRSIRFRARFRIRWHKRYWLTRVAHYLFCHAFDQQMLQSRFAHVSP